MKKSPYFLINMVVIPIPMLLQKNYRLLWNWTGKQKLEVHGRNFKITRLEARESSFSSRDVKSRILA